MKHLCLIYDEEKKMGGMSKSEADAFMRRVFRLHRGKSQKRTLRRRRSPAAGPDGHHRPRARTATVSTTDGPFAETKGAARRLHMIEARDLNDAIQVASKIPSARIGSIEVRPVVDFSKRSPGAGAAAEPSRSDQPDDLTRVQKPGASGFSRIPQVRLKADTTPVLNPASPTGARRRDLPNRVAPRPRHADSSARRFRSRGRSAPRRFHRGDGAVGRRRRSRQPSAWLVSAGRFKAIDAMRRRARFDASLGANWPRGPKPRRADAAEPDVDGVDDDRLRLIFTCCHPALPPDAQVALTLREVCGLDHRRDRARVPDRRADAWRSASCAPRRRFATRAFRIRCRRGPICRIGSTRVLRVDLPRVQRGLLGLVGRRR